MLYKNFKKFWNLRKSLENLCILCIFMYIMYIYVYLQKILRKIFIRNCPIQFGYSLSLIVHKILDNLNKI